MDNTVCFGAPDWVDERGLGVETEEISRCSTRDVGVPETYSTTKTVGGGM